jgi:peptidoglycan hydrolase FlgJ
MDISAVNAGKTAAALSTAEQQKSRKACRDFEAVFLNYMLKEMDKSVPREEGLIESSSADDLYRDMYYQEMATKMSEGGGIGIGDMMQKQLDTAAKTKKPDTVK